MEDTSFNINDLPWKDENYGRGKMILNRDVLGSSSLRLFCLDPHTEFESHEHSNIQVMIFTSMQKGFVLLDGEKRFDIVQDLVVVVKPNQCHRVVNESDEMMKVLVLDSYDAINEGTPFVDF